jgi:hypothetical protein
VIEQEYQEIRILGVGSTSTLERAFVHEFSVLVSQVQVLQSNSISILANTRYCTLSHKILARTEDQLLIQLSQVEKIFGFSALRIDSGQEFANNLNSFYQVFLVLMPFRSKLENHLQQQGIPCQTCRWFSKISIQLQLSRCWISLSVLCSQ